jgi:hAT family C-terminal dimerisation region
VDRNVAIETFVELYVPISNTLDALRTARDTSAEQLYHPINSFEMIMCTCIACFILSEITPLSRLLQTPCLDFGIAHHHVESLLVTLDSREANAAAIFHSVVFEQAREIAQVLFVQPSVPRSYQRRHGQTVLDPEMFYREQVFLPFVRELRANIAKRLSVFGQPRIQLLTRLRPEFITSTDCSTIELHKQLKEEFLDRLPQPLQLFCEIERWKKECIGIIESPNYTHMWVQELLFKCDTLLYPNIHFLLVFLATLPVTTSSAERSFSALKRVKTYCRSTMTENRLNGLAAAFIHKDVSIDPVKILELYVQKHKRRFDFGL